MLKNGAVKKIVIKLSTSPLFLFEIIRNGKRIYEKNKEQTISWEARILNFYYDTRYLRNIYRSYLKEAREKGTYGY